MESKSIWNIDTGVSNVKTKLKDFPVPQKPSTFGKEYDFPESIDSVTSQELGQWLFKLAAWKGFCLRILSQEEIEYNIMSDAFDSAVAKTIAENPDKKLTKDGAMGKLLLENPNMKKLRIDIIEKKAQVNSLKRLIEIYTLQFECVSREISRRNQDIKLLQGGM